jgi:DNA-directed RNA polymerase sigma subunit (sigma70/sigma32)
MIETTAQKFVANIELTRETKRKLRTLWLERNGMIKDLRVFFKSRPRGVFEYAILKLRHVDELTYLQIAKKYDVTCERIRQIEAKLLDVIRYTKDQNV